MKNIRAFYILLCMAILSCGKSAQQDCEKNHTGNILFHNPTNGFNTDSIRIFIGPTDLGIIRIDGQLEVGNQRPGKNLYTFTFRGDTLYMDSIVVTECSSVHYFIDFLPVSDMRLKKNIVPLSGILGDLMKLNIYSFEYRKAENAKGYLPGGTHYGFMAQELRTVYPDFVRTKNNGFYAVNYQEMIPLLVQGMKEQQQEIEMLKKEMAELKIAISMQQHVASN